MTAEQQVSNGPREVTTQLNVSAVVPCLQAEVDIHYSRDGPI